jgi:4-aminobutyrate aminotransferase-like enzyme
VLIIMPPLAISTDNLDQMLKVLWKAIEQAT